SSNNIHHFTLYGLDSGTVVSSSGPLSGASPSFTITNSLLNTDSNYVVTACTSDDIIQGAVSLRAGPGAISPLTQIHAWNNETNVPGATISAFVRQGQLKMLV